MAHLSSTSLFGLYLAMGGVLAASHGQCMLGWGEVANTPPLPSPLILLAARCRVNPGDSDADWEIWEISGQYRLQRNPPPPFCLHPCQCHISTQPVMQCSYGNRTMPRNVNVASFVWCLFVPPSRPSAWINMGPSQRGGGTTASTPSRAWSTQTWRQLRPWCVWAPGARASFPATTGRTPASPDPSPRPRTPATPSWRQRSRSPRRTLCPSPPWWVTPHTVQVSGHFNEVYVRFCKGGLWATVW